MNKPAKKMGRPPKKKEEPQTDDGVVIGFEKFMQEENFYGTCIVVKSRINPIIKYIAVVVTMILATMIYCSYEVYIATQGTQVSP